MLGVKATQGTDPERSHLMTIMVRQLDAMDRLSEQQLLGMVADVMPQQLLQEIAEQHLPANRRDRKLPAEVSMLLPIAMNLWDDDSLEIVLYKLLAGLRLVWPEQQLEPSSKSGISQARYRVGARPLGELFHRVCRPLATPDTPGAFLGGLRLVGIDGAVELAPATVANERAFGRHHSQYGPSAYLPVLGVYLMECGTHAIFDATFWPGHTAEDRGAHRLVRSLEPDMLVLLDAGLHSFSLLQAIRKQGAQVLSRLPSSVVLEPVAGLPDGSYLARLYDAPPSRRTRNTPFLLVRVLVYTLTDPERAGYGETHRLITTLLDHQTFPARDLIGTYHERWELELTVDELECHERRPLCPLRSRLPVGVIQELYGWLLAHYLVRAIMHEAAVAEGIDPDHVSFVHALQIIITAIPAFQTTDPHLHPILRQQLLADIRRFRVPERALRSNPRVVKRKSSKFPHKPPGLTGVTHALPFVHTIAVITTGASFQPTGQLAHA